MVEIIPLGKIPMTESIDYYYVLTAYKTQDMNEVPASKR